MPGRRPLMLVPDPDKLKSLRNRREAAQEFDSASEQLMILVQVWVETPSENNKNQATRALTRQLRAWTALNDAMP